MSSRLGTTAYTRAVCNALLRDSNVLQVNLSLKNTHYFVRKHYVH